MKTSLLNLFCSVLIASTLPSATSYDLVDQEHVTVKSRHNLGTHPFEDLAPHVKSIQYEAEKAYTIKLEGIFTG